MGRLRRLFPLKLSPSKPLHPPHDEEWRVLSGIVVHVTGTASNLALQTYNPVRTMAYLMRFPSGQANFNAALNPGYSGACVDALIGYHDTDTKGIWFGSDVEILFEGDATAYAFLLIEAVKIDPVTGEHLA